MIQFLEVVAIGSMIGAVFSLGLAAHGKRSALLLAAPGLFLGLLLLYDDVRVGGSFRTGLFNLLMVASPAIALVSVGLWLGRRSLNSKPKSHEEEG